MLVISMVNGQGPIRWGGGNTGLEEEKLFGEVDGIVLVYLDEGESRSMMKALS